MRFKSLLFSLIGIGLVALGAAGPHRCLAAGQPSDIPAWLQAHVGTDDGQIAPVVLQRARELYIRKVSEGAVRNPCYFAMDATRPGGLGRRFYVICEGSKTFRAIPSGHGSGRALPGLPDFSNGIQCAKNFSNAMDSKLTTGGDYTTAEIRTSLKGYYPDKGKRVPLMRSFLQFDGEGSTANARPRAIGGHPAVIVSVSCRIKAPGNPLADDEGYVPYGKLVDYSAGRSNGCTSWFPADAKRLLEMTENNPTTLYLYPEAADIDAVAQAVKAGRSLARAGLYWNASCLNYIRVPKFWPKETLEPALAKYKAAHPAPEPKPLPICKG